MWKCIFSMWNNSIYLIKFLLKIDFNQLFRFALYQNIFEGMQKFFSFRSDKEIMRNFSAWKTKEIEETRKPIGYVYFDLNKIKYILRETQNHCTQFYALIYNVHFLWLKSTLLLKIECQDTHIDMKTECLQTKWDTALFGWERKGYSCSNSKFNLLESLGEALWGACYKRSRENWSK